MENDSMVDDNNESTPYDFDWNVGKLVSSIEKLAVDFVNDKTLAKPTFPSEILATLSEDDIALLQDAIGLDDRDKYGYWRGIYVDLNLAYARSNELWSKAQSILSKIRSLPPEIPRGAVFLLLAEAILSAKDKEEYLKSVTTTQPIIDDSGQEITPLLEEIDALFHEGNIPTTRKHKAQGSNVRHAVSGLLRLFKNHRPGKRNQASILILLATAGIPITSRNVRDWRRRGFEMG
jgi:hypothetical protein